jgi:hypothetical protein
MCTVLLPPGENPIAVNKCIISFIFGMRNVSDKSCKEYQNAHFVFCNFFFLSFFLFGNRAICEIMWENIVERGSLKMTVWCNRIACWILKATSTHIQVV